MAVLANSEIVYEGRELIRRRDFHCLHVEPVSFQNDICLKGGVRVRRLEDDQKVDLTEYRVGLFHGNADLV